MTTVRSAWRVSDFRRLWSAGFSSSLGAEIGELAIPALALITLGASAAEASWVRAALMAPFLLMTLWLGVVVDRRRRRPLMILADLARGAVLVAVAVLAVVGWLTIPMLVAATFLLGSFTVLYQLADFSLLPRIVPSAALVDANAKVTATQSAVGVAGGGVGGSLVQLVTAPFAILANAVGYLASAWFIAHVRVTEEKERSERAAGSGLREAALGLRLVCRHRVLRPLVAEATVWNLGNEILMLALSVHFLQRVEHGALLLGLILTCGGVGAVVGSLLSTRMTARFGYGRSLVASLVVGNTAPLVGVMAAVAAPPFQVAMLGVGFVASGVGIGVANAQSTTIRQLATEDAVRGRVNAGYRQLSWGALAVGALCAGALVTLVGVWQAAALGGGLMMLATAPVVASSVPSMRDLADVRGHATSR